MVEYEWIRSWTPIKIAGNNCSVECISGNPLRELRDKASNIRKVEIFHKLAFSMKDPLLKYTVWKN